MAQPHTGIICTGPPPWTWDNELSAQNSHSNSRQKSAQDYVEPEREPHSDPIAQALKYAQRTGASVTITLIEETTVTETITFK